MKNISHHTLEYITYLLFMLESEQDDESMYGFTSYCLHRQILKRLVKKYYREYYYRFHSIESRSLFEAVKN